LGGGDGSSNPHPIDSQTSRNAPKIMEIFILF